VKTLIAGIILGWILNIVFGEYQNWEYTELTNDALDSGMKRRVEGFKGDQIQKYAERNRTKFLDYINFTPNLWTCRYTFTKDECLFKFLDRTLIPVKNRPKYKGKYY
jgi:hypothetical protein